VGNPTVRAKDHFTFEKNRLTKKGWKEGEELSQKLPECTPLDTTRQELGTRQKRVQAQLKKGEGEKGGFKISSAGLLGGGQVSSKIKGGGCAVKKRQPR